MRKNDTRGYIILGLFFILINVVTFAVPSSKTVAFWISYIFTVIAFVAQIVIWKVSFGYAESLKSKLLGFSIVHIGIVYLAVQIIIFVIYLSNPLLPIWSAIVVCTLIAGLYIIFMISSDVGRNEIERVSAKTQKKVFYINKLQADIEILIDIESNETTKIALRQLAEKIRFSDPMSAEEIADIENQITVKTAELKFSKDREKIISELNSLLDERNRKSKILK